MSIVGGTILLWFVIAFAVCVFSILVFVGIQTNKTPFYPQNHNKPIKRIK